MKTEITLLENQLLEAIKSSHVGVLDTLLHDDLLFIIPGGEVITKSMDLASHRAGTMVVEEITPTIEHINVIENTAVVIVVYDTRGKMMGHSIQGKFRYIRVWRLDNSQWKVIGGSCTML